MALLQRRDLTARERYEVHYNARPVRSHARTMQAYELLAQSLEAALGDAQFIALARTGMWLEFGVFRGMSTNLTSLYLERAAPDSSTVVDGFDTFTGLPEPWYKRQRPGGGGPLNLYFQAGAFSWAEHAKASGLGPRPPVRNRIRLHAGQFADTLPAFLAAQRSSRRVAWASVDCDLYTGTRDVLTAIGPRLAVGTRLHFHELLKLPDRGQTTAWLSATGGGGGSGRGAVLGRAGGHNRRQARARAAKTPEPGNAVPPSDEARALHEWLRRNPRSQLSVDNTQSARNWEAVMLVVHSV